MTCIGGLAVDDPDAERLSTLLTSLPALRSIRVDGICGLILRPLPGAPVAATQDFLALAARTIGRCSCLQDLDLVIDLPDKPANRVPATFWQYLAKARALEDLDLTIRLGAGEAYDGLTSVSSLITGLAGLSRLRTLTLSLDNVCGGATLPACVSRLVQLTSLGLSGLYGLRCAPGWARLPALFFLSFEDCVFASDGEAALPGMDALSALTSLELWGCSGLTVLPTSLWRLPQLRRLVHWSPSGEPRDELPLASLPASAPCFALLDSLMLSSDLPTWPACVLAMTRLASLDLSGSCCEQLPKGVSMLTALTHLGLGRHSAYGEIGGNLDVRALGNLACFPNLHRLRFEHCSVLFCPTNFQTADAHPCLEELVLKYSYPARGPSFQAFLDFVIALLRQDRADMLRIHGSIVRGAGQQVSQGFKGALYAMGLSLPR